MACSEQSHNNDIGEKVGQFILQALIKVAPHRLNLTAFTRQNVKNEAPSKPGLYLLLFETPTGYEVFYVGQSNNLKRRLLEHLKQPTTPNGLYRQSHALNPTSSNVRNHQNDCIKKHLSDHDCYYHYVEIRHIKFLSMLESELIRTYLPPCNHTDHR